MIRTLMASAAVIALTAPSLACGDMAICRIADSKVATLDVFETIEGGKVVASLTNGTEIEVVDYASAGSVEWVQVALSGPSWGYVPESALICSTPDEYSEICTIKTEAGALSVLEEPNGLDYGQLPDGIKVRPYDHIEVDGVKWAAIERWGEDNALGWILNASINCDDGHEHSEL